MAWSTRELAELAGTTVNAVRHYHRLGLLPEPDRRVNNYKQYGVRELVQLLRIRRLVSLGVPLSKISGMRGGGASDPAALQAVDAQLAERIAQLQQARADIAAIVDGHAPADVPHGFESVAARLSETDSAMIHVYTQLYDQDALDDVRRMVEADADPVEAEFNALDPESDEETRARLTEALAPVIAQHLADYPWLNDPAGHLSKREPVVQQTFIETVVELYNPAQIDVLARASVRAQELVGESPASDEPPPAGAAGPAERA